jgi:YggT family protein
MRAILDIVDNLLFIYTWVVIAAAFMTWVNPDPRNVIVQLLRRLTEPVFWRIRRLVPTLFGGLDIAPLLLILAIVFVREVVLSSLILNF